ncbi:MAG: hypothetical protein SZ59_C0002G0230 [candidate division TM6 bacterium GW2011_GWF2_28_16]|nr:MAG: hypothetical protein SZ59_C0002G0230 [candidate division TM6 bacterium GW2011_GWF2_28_16]
MIQFKFIFKKLFLFLFLILTSQNIFSELPKDTFVRTGLNITDIKKVQDLNVGETVLSFKQNDLGQFEFINIPITQVTIKKQNNNPEYSQLVIIDTTSNNNINSQLIICPGTKFYNYETNTWINSCDLSINNKLFNLDSNFISINKISLVELNSNLEFYDLSLEEPNCFFICDSIGQSILIHNMDIAVQQAPKILSFAKDMAAVGAAAAASAYASSKFEQENNRCYEYHDLRQGQSYNPQRLYAQQVNIQPKQAPAPKLPPQNNIPSGPNKDPKKNNSSQDKYSQGDACKITSNTSKAPEKADPNSAHYKLDNTDKKTVVSKTVYNNNGQPDFRDDFDHSHFDTITKTNINGPHKHTFEYNEKGQIIKPIKVTPLNKG